MAPLPVLVPPRGRTDGGTSFSSAQSWRACGCGGSSLAKWLASRKWLAPNLSPLQRGHITGGGASPPFKRKPLGCAASKRGSVRS